MKKPAPLRPGDIIGVVAPASPLGADKVWRAKALLEGWGFEVKLGRSCFSQHGYLAGGDQLRANDLNSFFYDPSIAGIICLRGGFGTMRIMSYLNLSDMASTPKVFVGYSDITFLHVALNQKAGLVTFHGPMVGELVRGEDEETGARLLQVISKPVPLGLVTNPKGKPIECLVKGTAQGPIMGGNLSLLVATLGTPYEIDTKDKILLLEETREEPYRIDRMLTQLVLAGKLNDTAGIVLGAFESCYSKNPRESLELKEILADAAQKAGNPAILGLQVGHCRPNLTIPLGVQASLQADEGQLFIEESATTC